MSSFMIKFAINNSAVVPLVYYIATMGDFNDFFVVATFSCLFKINVNKYATEMRKLNWGRFISIGFFYQLMEKIKLTCVTVCVRISARNQLGVLSI